MKKMSAVVLGLVCLLAVSRFALAQDVLSQGFEKARTLVSADKNAVLPAEEKRAVEPGHDLGNVTGTDISMKVHDHAVAGAINGGVAWGFYSEEGGVATLIMRKYGQTITAEFKQQANRSFGGVISSNDGTTQRTTTVFFAGADAANKKFKLLINGEEVVVSISPEGMAGGHYVNPTYSAVIGGKPVSYRIEVEGCLGYSINMGMIILGAYAH